MKEMAASESEQRVKQVLHGLANGASCGDTFNSDRLVILVQAQFYGSEVSAAHRD